MTTKTTDLDFSGQNIYVGMDIHKKQFTVSIAGEDLIYKTFSQPPKPELLVEYLHRNYPGARYKAVYEAGFCGFWIQKALQQLGIDCIIANPADVPTSDKEKKQKRDSGDSRKLVRSLRSNELSGIYIPSQMVEHDRTLIRTRQRIIGNQTRCRNRIKSMLFYFGIEIPERFHHSGTHWSNQFMTWLKQIDLGNRSSNLSMSLLIEEAMHLRKALLSIEKELKLLSNEPRYASDFQLLISIPGIGRLTALVILTELNEITRFKRIDDLCSYIGLIPNVYASGEKEKIGNLTSRGNKLLRSLLIESAWMAIRNDPAMTMAFNQLRGRMESNKAIIRIVKKLISRVRHILITKEKYKLGVRS